MTIRPAHIPTQTAPERMSPDRTLAVSPVNIPGWQNFPIVERFRNMTNLETVTSRGDAIALTHAEHRFGAGRGCSHMLGVVVSTGIGGGLILDGRRGCASKRIPAGRRWVQLLVHVDGKVKPETPSQLKLSTMVHVPGQSASQTPLEFLSQRPLSFNRRYSTQWKGFLPWS